MGLKFTSGFKNNLLWLSKVPKGLKTYNGLINPKMVLKTYYSLKIKYEI